MLFIVVAALLLVADVHEAWKQAHAEQHKQHSQQADSRP